MRFLAQRVGTHMYWGASAEAFRPVPVRSRVPGGMGLFRPRFDSQLAGAFIVDPAGDVPNDRVFVITENVPCQPNPAGCPHRERHGLPARRVHSLERSLLAEHRATTLRVGDTVRWRIVNTIVPGAPDASARLLLSRRFARDARTAPVDSIYSPEQRRMAVTEPHRAWRDRVHRVVPRPAGRVDLPLPPDEPRAEDAARSDSPTALSSRRCTSTAIPTTRAGGDERPRSGSRCHGRWRHSSPWRAGAAPSPVRAVEPCGRRLGESLRLRTAAWRRAASRLGRVSGAGAGPERGEPTSIRS